MNIQEKEIQVRDKDAQGFEEWYLGKGILYDWVEKRVIYNTLNLQPNDVVLDAGCGTGRLSMDIAKRCKKVYGVDFSPKSIEILNKKAQEGGIQNIETHTCDLTDPIPIKEKVDKIISTQAIHHIPGDNERHKALKNLYNQLKPGGICVVTLYNWRTFYYPQLIKEGEFEVGIYYFRFTPEEAEALFKECGFKDISIRGCINYKRYASSKFHKLLYLIANLDTFLSKFNISCLFGDFLICKGTK